MNNQRPEKLVSIILQTGVIVSAGIILGGLILFLIHSQGSSHYSYQQLIKPSYHYPHNFPSLATALRHRSSLGIILLGALLLILTPVIRVASSIFIFVKQKDRPMTLVTLLVLLVLIGSFILGANSH